MLLLFFVCLVEIPVDAIMEVKAAYQVKRNWMGDPCVPSNFTWDGLNCSFGGSESPRIIYL